LRLRNKICIITGGGSGIGKAACLLFAREGAIVVVADKVAKAAAGNGAIPCEVEVADSRSVRRMIADAVGRFGRLDVLVNNAGYGIRDRAAYCASKGAVAALTRARALDHVTDNIRINAIASGTIDSSYFQDMFAKSSRPAELRRELESRQAMNRLGQPEEIANGMLFLASEESAFLTGAILTIDGGMTAQ
jgi:meso-butanediol dehydrogenase / (S,S)-butanediol dehydrogenase / diacetyl reductase